MIQQFFIALLATLARMVIAYACGVALLVLSGHVAPDAPLAAYIALRLISRITLALFIIRIKLVITIRRRRALDDRR